MSAEVIPFDFEEQAVRVMMRDGEPWFVAADVCRVLEIQNVTQAVQRLDEDEATLCQTEGNHRPMNLISESGLYALIVRSDKPNARRFRKWVTAEVLPSIRKTGRYDLPDAPDTAPAPSFDEMGPRDWLAMIREARILGGTTAGRRMWSLSPLPPLKQGVVPAAGPSAEEGRACLDHLLDIEAEGATVREWCGRTFGDDPVARKILTAVGLRMLEGGLFIANGTQLLVGTIWGGGLHRPALLAIPGAYVHAGVLTLAGWSTRGIVVPFASIEEARDAQDA